MGSPLHWACWTSQLYKALLSAHRQPAHTRQSPACVPPFARSLLILFGLFGPMGAAKDMVVEDDAGSKKGNALDQEAVDRELAGYRAVAAQEGRCQEAIDGLLGLEKRGRVAEDVVSTRKACSVLLEVRAGGRQAGGSKASVQFVRVVALCLRSCRTLRGG